jgi:hypothetical protein
MSLNGSGRSSIASINPNIAEFAPIPSASVTAAIKVKPGFFRNIRAP